MLLIPAIDIKDGKCTPATTIHGRDKSNTVDDPVAVAQQWVVAGARRLHVVDMDSVQSGKPMSVTLIRAIVDNCAGIPVQVSGGMRSDTQVESYFDAGAEFVILGTKTASTPHYINNLCLEYPGHILLELDTRDGRLDTEGWSKLANHEVLEVAENFQREGVAGILYSDKQASGMHGVINTAAFSLAQALTLPVILANRLSSVEDIHQLYTAGASGLAGALVSILAEDFAQAQKFAGAPPDEALA